jgi:hypothetical protein
MNDALGMKDDDLLAPHGRVVLISGASPPRRWARTIRRVS